jgi:hypothetical protein
MRSIAAGLDFAATRLGVIMSPEPGQPHEAWGVLNPGGARSPDGTMHLFPRLIAPRQEVRRDGDGDTRLVRDERRVRREVTLEPRHVHDAWIFHSAAPCVDLVRFVRFECDPEPLDTHRRLALETHACVSDPRIVPKHASACRATFRSSR